MLTYAESESRFAAMPGTSFRTWRPAQLEAFDIWESRDNQRLLVYYPTGKGKTKISLAMAAAKGHTEIVVVGIPKTLDDWAADAALLGLTMTGMSHELFRQKTTRLKRGSFIIVDEFHKLGKHNGMGFKKLDRMSTQFSGIILLSATPQYNDPDRCYNACHIMEPLNYMGGWEAFVKKYCTIEVNYFARTPTVTGFLDFPSGTEFLASQPWTAYIPDEAEWIPIDLELYSNADLSLFEEYGLDIGAHRIMASDMERFHARKRLVMLDDSGRYLRPEIAEGLVAYMDAQILPRKFLLFSDNKDIAKAAHRTLMESPYVSTLITGDTPESQVERIKLIFVFADMPAVLVGTSALATGVDEIDQACNHLIILDNTRDDAQRRQLIGRVLPRGGKNRDTIVTTTETSLCDQK